MPTPHHTQLRRRSAAAGLGMILFALTGQSAHVHSESFGTSAAGWTNEGQWATFGVTNGHLWGRFSASGGPPTPQFGLFIATNTASAGAFTGDYDAAGLTLIGFSIYAADARPQDLLVRWYGGDGFSYFRSGLASNIVSTGVWYTLTFPLQNKTAGGWFGSSETNFAAARQAVTRFEIRVDRNGSAAQQYFVDPVFVDSHPALLALAADSGSAVLSLGVLQTGATYRIEAADTATGTWTHADTLIATNRVMPWPVPDASFTTRFFRVAQDERTP